jgi:3-oxoacyl-[acyl-carrier protein] reductase
MAVASQVALVTGAGRGIGRGIAIELARAGFSVAINYATRRHTALQCAALCRAAAPPGAQSCFEVFRADISRRADRARLLKAVLSRFRHIDILVNNAGVAPRVRADLLEAGEESFGRLIAINVRGPFFLTQALAKIWIAEMKRRAKSRPRPKIINISSVSAFAPGLARGEYCMSKAALSMMTQLFAIRLAGHGINVYEIRPGIIYTDMVAPVKEQYARMIAEGVAPIARWGTPEDVGRAVAAIAQDQFPFSTGEVINVDGGFHIRRL